MQALEYLLVGATRLTVWFIETMVLAAILAATVWATWQMLAVLRVPGDRQREHSRQIWLTYSRWLVAALTLQIGADILESSIAPSWQAIAQLGAIATIRTFLSYFLERDIREATENSVGKATS